MTKKERLKEIDIIRGVTIFLVVLGHSGMSDGILAEILKDFRMPLFFMVSGYLFSNSKYMNNMISLVDDKFRTLIIPYISFGILAAVFWNTIQFIGGREMLWIKSLAGLLYGNGNWIIGNDPIWFLVCLFIAFIIFNIVLQLTKERSPVCKVISFLLIGFIGYFTSQFIWLPMSFDIALTAVLFMFVGNLLKTKGVLLNHRMLRNLTVISIALFILAVFFNIPLDMNNRVYGNFFWFYLGGITGSIVMLFIAKYILSKSNFVCSVFSAMGKESIVILGLHYCIGIYIVNLLEKIINISIVPLLTAIIATCCSLLLGRFINKVPILSFLFKGESPPKTYLVKESA